MSHDRMHGNYHPHGGYGDRGRGRGRGWNNRNTGRPGPRGDKDSGLQIGEWQTPEIPTADMSLRDNAEPQQWNDDGTLRGNVDDGGWGNQASSAQWNQQSQEDNEWRGDPHRGQQYQSAGAEGWQQRNQQDLQRGAWTNQQQEAEWAVNGQQQHPAVDNYHVDQYRQPQQQQPYDQQQIQQQQMYHHLQQQQQEWQQQQQAFAAQQQAQHYGQWAAGGYAAKQMQALSMQQQLLDQQMQAGMGALSMDPGVQDPAMTSQPPQSPVDSMWGNAIPTEHLPAAKEPRGRPILGGVANSHQPGMMGDVTGHVLNPHAAAFQFSVNAQEFVPRMVGQPQYVPEYPPYEDTRSHGNHYRGGAEEPKSEADDGPVEFTSDSAMENVQKAITVMTSNPEALETIAEPLVTSLSATIRDEATLRKVVHEIFRKAQAESNFRYTGAKLCERLVNDLKVEYSGTTFTTLLLQRCREEHKTRAEDIKNIGKRATVIGFALFMGELLVNISADGCERRAWLSDSIQEMLLTLLEEGDEGCLRCVVQLIKLAGSHVEEIEKKKSRSRKPETEQKEEKSEGVEAETKAEEQAAGEGAEEEKSGLEVVFDKLKAIAVAEGKSRRIRSMVLSVIELRASNWGLISPSTTGAATSTAPPPAPPAAEEPQIPPDYWPGSPANPDEMPSLSDEDSEPYFLSPQDDPEMDDEIAEAFEDFLKSNKNGTSK